MYILAGESTLGRPIERSAKRSTFVPRLWVTPCCGDYSVVGSMMLREKVDRKLQMVLNLSRFDGRDPDIAHYDTYNSKLHVEHNLDVLCICS
jgi:hypothetical protein